MKHGKSFEGLKVVDLSSALNGPFCTMFLADYGADVTKMNQLAENSLVLGTDR